MWNTWEFSITGEDGVRLTDNDPKLADYEEHVVSLHRFFAASLQW